MALFLSVGFVVHLLLGLTRKRLALLALVDTLALLTHPYAVVWIAMRWLVSLVPRPLDGLSALGPYRRGLSYLLPVAMAALVQASEILVARDRFHDLHNYFTLQPYPPSPVFFADLVGHMGTGPGVHAALWAAAALYGLFVLSDRTPAVAVRTMAYGLLTPLLLLAVIYPMGGRFSFTHMLPAAVPLYFMVGAGVVGLARLPGPGRAVVAMALIMAVPLALMVRLDVRYLARGSRLEMGADLPAFCTARAQGPGPGDAVITLYDKYFTQFAFYCGPELPPEVAVAVPDHPDSAWVVGFNHLFVEKGEPYLPPERVVRLDDYLASAGRGRTIYVVAPLFEPIESRFSETLGWYSISSEYAHSAGEDHATPEGWKRLEYDLVYVYYRTLDGSENMEALRATVDRLLERSRRWI